MDNFLFFAFDSELCLIKGDPVQYNKTFNEIFREQEQFENEKSKKNSMGNSCMKSFMNSAKKLNNFIGIFMFAICQEIHMKLNSA